MGQQHLVQNDAAFLVRIDGIGVAIDGRCEIIVFPAEQLVAVERGREFLEKRLRPSFDAGVVVRRAQNHRDAPFGIRIK
jgi:hypothetical protein